MTESVELTTTQAVRRENPYVGPRAFRTGEPLYARSRETHELANLLIAERIVLLHAPSGAGKTSIIRAGLEPQLRERRFEPTMPLRVNTPPPGPVRNRYVYSVALGLLDSTREPEELGKLTLSAAVKEAVDRTDGRLVLVIDQFEEILTLDPTDWVNQTAFFKDLGEALAANRIWALLSMREDYIGGLDRYLRYVPGHLRTTYRLDFLERRAAKAAIQLPARDQGIDFTDEAADELVRRLAVVRVQRPGSVVDEVDAPYVQPVQLQVVCRRLWRSLSKERGDNFDAIERDDVERYADIEKALRNYYSAAVADVASETGVPEMALRDWFETALITAEGFRSQSVKGPETGDVEPATVLRALEQAYLIRSDTRAQATWFELAHDMLIEPIRRDNAKWSRRRLQPWQLAAREWATDRQVGRLLQGSELRDANRRAHKLELTQTEREFLDESERAERQLHMLNRMHGAVSLVGTAATIELLLIIVLAVLLFTR